MKHGRTLQELAQEIERRRELAEDFLVPAREITVASEGLMGFAVGDEEYGLGMKPLAHGQLATHLAIPKKFYDYLRVEHPGVYNTTVNGLLERAEPDDRRMVRTLDGEVRAVLSNQYRRVDDYDIASIVLRQIGESMPDAVVKSCEVTDTNLYLKVLMPKLTGELKVGEIVQAGFMVKNSEVGASSLVVAPLLYVLSCTNGQTFNKLGMSMRHVGRRIGQSDEARQLYREETLRADDKAFLMKVEDIIGHTVTETLFNDLLLKMRQLEDIEITGAVPEVAVKLQKEVTLTDTERDGVITYLAKGGNLSAYGLVAAITAFGQTVESYDRSSELEEIGGELILAPARLAKIVA